MKEPTKIIDGLITKAEALIMPTGEILLESRAAQAMGQIVKTCPELRDEIIACEKEYVTLGKAVRKLKENIETWFDESTSYLPHEFATAFLGLLTLKDWEQVFAAARMMGASQ